MGLYIGIYCGSCAISNNTGAIRNLLGGIAECQDILIGSNVIRNQKSSVICSS